jgi:hypothetical protein
MLLRSDSTAYVARQTIRFPYLGTVRARILNAGYKYLFLSPNLIFSFL